MRKQKHNELKNKLVVVEINTHSNSNNLNCLGFIIIMSFSINSKTNINETTQTKEIIFFCSFYFSIFYNSSFWQMIKIGMLNKNKLEFYYFLLVLLLITTKTILIISFLFICVCSLIQWILSLWLFCYYNTIIY